MSLVFIVTGHIFFLLYCTVGYSSRKSKATQTRRQPKLILFREGENERKFSVLDKSGTSQGKARTLK